MGVRLPGDQQEIEFYRLWTLKESLIKARRLDLSRPNLTIEFQRENDCSKPSWYCYHFRFKELYCALSLPEPLRTPPRILLYRPDADPVQMPLPELLLYSPTS